MQIVERHRWDLSTTEARALQNELASEVNTTRPLRPWKTVAGADVSYNRFSPWLHAAVVILDARTGEIVEQAGTTDRASFPYVPGLLSFREIPPLIQVFEKLKTVPDVILCDGQGIAHPRRLGLATHLGLWLGVPTVGCAKSRLCGTYEEPGLKRGSQSPLVDRGEVVGAVLRTRDRVKPLFVSPGHLCDLEGAVEIVLEQSGKYRLPTPTRLAHLVVNELRREVEGPRTKPD